DDAAKKSLPHSSQHRVSWVLASATRKPSTAERIHATFRAAYGPRRPVNWNPRGQRVPCGEGLAYPGTADAGPWPTRHWRFLPVMQPGPRGGDPVIGDAQRLPPMR